MKLNSIISVVKTIVYGKPKIRLLRQSTEGFLQHISKTWQPDLVFDVGAAYGSWTEVCAPYFPDANFILCEPLPAFVKILKRKQKTWPKSIIIPKVISAKNGHVSFFVHQDLVGSSTKREIEGKEIDGRVTTIPATTLDNIWKDNSFAGSVLLKVDVQGAELEVLSGASKVLDMCECVILEVSLFRSMKTGADIFEVMEFMKKHGFVCYDIIGFLYRPYDQALCQMDVVFVKEHGIFRTFQGYATKEQRQKQNLKFQQKLAKILSPE
jgi:FkbM family methyltransferase